MWLARPVYEFLPYYYMALGVVAAVGGYSLDRWYWAEILGVAGALSLVGGLVLWLKRRAYRRSRSRLDVQDQA
jgi:predicted MFS family arabinose efflux permease